MPNLRLDKNKKAARQRFSFPFPELRWSLFKFNSRKNCQNLTNWTRWNKRDQVWSSATLPQFKWRFCSRRRSCCFKSSVLGTLRSDDGDGNGNATKPIGLITKKQQFCTCITLFCTFLCRHCTTTTWKFHVVQRKYTSDDEISSLFLHLAMVLTNSTLGWSAYIWE